MQIIHHIFQLLPIVLAIIAAILCSLKLSSDRRLANRRVYALAIIASVLMIIAQTSWWSSYLIENSLEGTWFANILWTIFNSLVMTVFILMALPFNKLTK